MPRSRRLGQYNAWCGFCLKTFYDDGPLPRRYATMNRPRSYPSLCERLLQHDQRVPKGNEHNDFVRRLVDDIKQFVYPVANIELNDIFVCGVRAPGANLKQLVE